METAIRVLLESVKCEENSTTQALAASILSNIGGTYSWTGEPYTITWLLKKAGLTSLQQRNMIRNFDFLNESLHHPATDAWSNKLARRLIKYGIPVFHALEKGLKSKTKRVYRDSLTVIAWLGCEIIKSSGDVRYVACETILSSVEQYIHPGIDLEERILACLCIYNYTYGRGMKKLFNFSEGVRESLRRLSGSIWLAEELLKVAEYLQPNKWRISCVHTQIMEAGDNSSGAVTALTYYNGYLCSGYEDGSIKLWDIKGQTATLIWDRKEHEKAVRCFAIYEPGNRLLSGSSDKTIKIWQMVQTNLECVEVIRTKEAIRNLDASGKDIFAITKSHKLKVFDSSGKGTNVLKSKRVKSFKLSKGKLYLGCLDSSIQELSIAQTRQLELKAATKTWMLSNKPINSLAIYKDWLYSASVILEGSTIKDWKRITKPQITLVPERKSNILAMEVVEDFIYLNCSGSSNNLQVCTKDVNH
ncbi:hypothetical protein Leryth_020900 [Lithospermum erythrorhizon]|nr:hypothetical protein Leryth_020900 [Lithospermum erythrorhizon]